MTYLKRRKPHMVAAIAHANALVPPDIKTRNGSGRQSAAWSKYPGDKWNLVYHTELERLWQCSTK